MNTLLGGVAAAPLHALTTQSEKLVGMTQPPAARTWVEFVDPANELHRVRADLHWLTSRYTCIFGRGCVGIDTDRPADTCCTLGAHFTDVADVNRVTEAVSRLTPQLWARHTEASEDWYEVPQDSEPDADHLEGVLDVTTGEDVALATRVVDEVCVFFNRPDSGAPYGCSLHHLALAEGVPPHTIKPDVCWQVPLRRTYRLVECPDETSYLEITLGEYSRGAWGPGGHDFAWWCTDSPLAHVAEDALYLTQRAELEELIGVDAYAELARHCEAHMEAVAAVRERRPQLLPLFVHSATLGAGHE